MSSSILKQIAELGRLSARDLQDRWRELYGSEPPSPLDEVGCRPRSPVHFAP
jgi:hypothetical protein